VPTVRIPIKLAQVRDDSCSERIQVNVADKFEEIWILLAQDGFVAVLKKMPRAVMPTVEVDRIACQQPSHDHREIVTDPVRTSKWKWLGMSAQAKQLVEVSDKTVASRSTK